MRTLKKVLALTVVLATLLSISAFAAFSDEESIDESFVDAVNLLGALNVMTGDTEGTFRPNDTIMRAEAAKMIYVIRNGGVDDLAAGWTGMSTFSDVTPGVWYEGYVNYCASLGIIAGIGGGKFKAPHGAGRATGTGGHAFPLQRTQFSLEGIKPNPALRFRQIFVKLNKDLRPACVHEKSIYEILS